MATRVDQLHSHQFARHRVVAALATGDPHSGPPRRTVAPVVTGVVVAVLALAAMGVYGLLRPAEDSSWRDGRAVIIEQETGARFVYLDGVLHPALNYASALLILGSASPARVFVARATLAGVPRGAPLGIQGAPDPLPAAADLVSGDWTVCSRPAAGTPESVLLVGSAPVGGLTALGDRALLAADPAGGQHLLWHGRRFAIDRPDIVLTALGWRGQAATMVAPALLNAVPAGSDLAPVDIDERGRPSALPGYQVGTVFVVVTQGGGRQYGVALAQGVAAVTQIQADLLLADPRNGGGAAVTLSLAQYSAAPAAPSLVPDRDGAPPASTPTLAASATTSAPCASFHDATAAPAIGLATMTPAVGEVRVGAGARVDWVAVAPGRGALVESLAAPAAPGGTVGVVSDLGVFFPVPSSSVLAMLGYAGVSARPLPAAVVALLPAGNALDPVAARRTT